MHRRTSLTRILRRASLARQHPLLVCTAWLLAGMGLAFGLAFGLVLILVFALDLGAGMILGVGLVVSLVLLAQSI